MKKILLLLSLLLPLATFAQTAQEITNIITPLGQDLFITGQGAQSASGNNIILAVAGSGWTDTQVAGGVSYRSGLVEVDGSAGIASGQIIFEGTNNTSAASFLPLYALDEIANTGVPLQVGQNIAASTARYFSFKITTRYIRCRISTVFSGGTVQAFTRLFLTDYVPRVSTVVQTNAGNLAQNMAQLNAHTVVEGGVNGVLAVGGNVAHSAAVTANPLTIGGVVVPTTAATQDQTLVAGDVMRMPMTTGQQVMTKPFSTAENDWTFAAGAAGILNTTTAVTFKAASGTAGIRNYITGIQVQAEALGTATELAVRDGAAGTVIWRIKIGTGGLPNGLSIFFPTPLKGTANTLMEVVTLTASTTGAVYFNAQGYTGF